jgi:hypothetical protein
MVERKVRHLFWQRIFFYLYGYTSNLLGYNASYEIWSRVASFFVYVRLGECYGKYIIYKTMSVQVMVDVQGIDPRALNQNWCLGCTYYKENGFWYYGNPHWKETKGLVRSL